MLHAIAFAFAIFTVASLATHVKCDWRPPGSLEDNGFTQFCTASLSARGYQCPNDENKLVVVATYTDQVLNFAT